MQTIYPGVKPNSSTIEARQFNTFSLVLTFKNSEGEPLPDMNLLNAQNIIFQIFKSTNSSTLKQLELGSGIVAETVNSMKINVAGNEMDFESGNHKYQLIVIDEEGNTNTYMAGAFIFNPAQPVL